MIQTPRYLVPFHPKHISHYFTDVLVIGAGLAGLRAANAVSAEQSVLVLAKGKLEESNSSWAQGGVAGVLAPDDRFESHIADTIEAGGALCDRKVVDSVIREAPQRIHELIEWGVEFDTEGDQLMLGREGGHSHHRIVHARGDATGWEIMRGVIQWTRRRSHIEIRENTFTIDLLTHDGRCHGALIWNDRQQCELVWAKQTILCTGGAGQLYRETTNPTVATADGHALAFRAGVELRDMEFMQFHPTVLYIAGSSRSLITEAVRGEGAHLVDRRGRRFMLEYDSRAELAPRDIVSQAIVSQMEATRHPNVYLDLSHLDPAHVLNRFPGIAEACAKFELDITRDRIPVRPGAHYMIGGVPVDERGHTQMPGLWAAGEVTSSGLHGANRLASNSLLESLVYGARSGEGASRAAADQPDCYQALALQSGTCPHIEKSLDLADIRNSLQSLMWRSAGVRRDEEQLTDAAAMVANWLRYVSVRQFTSPAGWELQNMLTVAGVILEAAREREESRGVHLRTDYPGKDDPRWCRRLSFRRA